MTLQPFSSQESGSNFLMSRDCCHTNFEAHQIHFTDIASLQTNWSVPVVRALWLVERVELHRGSEAAVDVEWSSKRSYCTIQNGKQTLYGLHAVANSMWNTVHHDFTHEGYTAAAADYLWNSDQHYTHEVCNAAASSIINIHHQIIHF